MDTGGARTRLSIVVVVATVWLAGCGGAQEAFAPVASPAAADPTAVAPTEPVLEDAAPLEVTDITVLDPLPGELMGLAPSGRVGITVDDAGAVCAYTVGDAAAPISCADVPTPEIGPSPYVSWSADEAVVALSFGFTVGEPADVWRWVVADGTLTNLTEGRRVGEEVYTYPIVSPDGERVVFFELVPDGPNWMRMARADDSVTSDLAAVPDGPQLLSGVWPPDSSAFYFTVHDSTAAQTTATYRVDTAAAATPEPVVSGVSATVASAAADGGVLLLYDWATSSSQGNAVNTPFYAVADPTSAVVQWVRQPAPAAETRYLKMTGGALTADGASVIYAYRTEAGSPAVTEGQAPGQLRVVQAPVAAVLDGDERERVLVEDLWSAFDLSDAEYVPMPANGGGSWTDVHRRVVDGQLVWPVIVDEPQRPAFVRLELAG